MTTDPPDLRRIPRAARPVTREWQALASPTTTAPPFDPAMTDGLPAPVARWLRHTIEPGTPVTGSVLLTMHGRIRIGAWRPFRATQVLAVDRGFVWSATARIAGVRVAGFDRFTDGTGEMRWRLLGAVPVMSMTGPDVTRSAAGRLAVETTMAPTATLASGARWTPVDDATAVAEVDTDLADGRRVTHRIEVTVDDDGRLVSAVTPRWGNPLGEPFGLHPFGAYFTGERSSGGVTTARRVEAGWFAGTPRWPDGVFFRAGLDDVGHR